MSESLKKEAVGDFKKMKHLENLHTNKQTSILLKATNTTRKHRNKCVLIFLFVRTDLSHCISLKAVAKVFLWDNTSFSFFSNAECRLLSICRLWYQAKLSEIVKLCKCMVERKVWYIAEPFAPKNLKTHLSGVYGKILILDAYTELTTLCLYSRSQSRFSRTDLLFG